MDVPGIACHFVFFDRRSSWRERERRYWRGKVPEGRHTCDRLRSNRTVMKVAVGNVQRRERALHCRNGKTKEGDHRTFEAINDTIGTAPTKEEPRI